MASSDHKLEDFAEELGKLLGTAQAKAEGWLGQRKQISQTLIGIRDTATKLLTDLGHEAQGMMKRRGRPVGSTNQPAPPGKRTRRRMSAKARAAISAAQKARWAKLKAGARKRKSA